VTHSCFVHVAGWRGTPEVIRWNSTQHVAAGRSADRQGVSRDAADRFLRSRATDGSLPRQTVARNSCSVDIPCWSHLWICSVCRSSYFSQVLSTSHSSSSHLQGRMVQSQHLVHYVVWHSNKPPAVHSAKSNMYLHCLTINTYSYQLCRIRRLQDVFVSRVSS